MTRDPDRTRLRRQAADTFAATVLESVRPASVTNDRG